MNDIERLYQAYRDARKGYKPGLEYSLDVVAGPGYAGKRDALSETIKDSLIRHNGLDTTADMADQIAADVLKMQWGL